MRNHHATSVMELCLEFAVGIFGHGGAAWTVAAANHRRAWEGTGEE